MPASKKPTIRRVVVYLFAVGILVLASPVPLFFCLGAVVVVLGELLRIWACGHLRKNQAVIKSGPYAHVKNPLYLGTFLILVGCVLAASDPANHGRYVLVVALPFTLGVFFFYYLPYKFAVEGDRLRRRFGPEFDEYDRNVPAFVPRITPFAKSEAKWDAKLVVKNSEVSAAIWALLGLVALFGRMHTEIPGIPW